MLRFDAPPSHFLAMLTSDHISSMPNSTEPIQRSNELLPQAASDLDVMVLKMRPHAD
jgi:hypothetical protein